MAKTIAIIAALDTKGVEAQFIAQIIRERGHRPLVIDVGVMAESASPAPDIGAAQSLADQMQPLADALLNGVDADGDGVIEAGPGEGGARDAYNHAQYMAAMGVAFGSENP